MENVRVYRGGTVAFDMGVLLTVGDLSLGAGFYDVNYPEFRWKVNEETPEGFDEPKRTIEGSSRVGMGYEPSFGVPGLLDEFKFALDVQSPLSDKMGTFKKICLGMEVRFGGFMLVRTGLHQGYPTAGAAVLLKVLKLEYAFSGEALGRHPGQLERWSHFFTVGLGWGF
jgi:hypothetical protein